MRDQIVAFWSVQDSLLQSYRNMAVTLLGLISAGILVSVARVGETWPRMSCLSNAYATLGWPQTVANLTLYAMLIVLLFLGAMTSTRFKSIATTRGLYVTYFQNLLIAEENGELKEIAGRYGLPYPLNLMHLFRQLSNKNFKPMTFERNDPNENATGFNNYILQIGTVNDDEAVRQDKVRKFLNTWIYTVFNLFFFLCFVFFALSVVNLFC